MYNRAGVVCLLFPPQDVTLRPEVDARAAGKFAMIISG